MRLDDDATTPGATAARELAEALLRNQAAIEPKHFYDPLGASLFAAITQLPEYPLTRVEAALVARHREEMVAAMGAVVASPGMELVDLGAGDCAKARTWIDALAPRAYLAVDFSIDEAALERLCADLPELQVKGVRADFVHGLALPAGHGGRQCVALYPGSSIGNFSPLAARDFLAGVRKVCSGGLLLGVDLVKPVSQLELAYDDPLGVTAAFNRNVLRNVNRVLGSDFDVLDWAHRVSVDEGGGRVRMFLQARRDLVVRWPGGERRFEQGECIHTEDSCKWRLDELEALLVAAGYRGQRIWTDTSWGFAVAWAWG
jgi:dimethylhistidine N-methyltransferase